MKGLDVLIKSLSDILAVFPHTYLLLVGEGTKEYKSNLKTLIQELGLSNKIIFTGYIKQRDLPKYYSVASIFISPSHMETAPLAIREAIAIGVPVVAVNVGGTSEYVRDGLDGILISAVNEKQIADAVIKLLLKVNIKRAKTSKKRFTWDRYIIDMKKIFNEILKKFLQYKK